MVKLKGKGSIKNFENQKKYNIKNKEKKEIKVKRQEKKLYFVVYAIVMTGKKVKPKQVFKKKIKY